MGGSNPGGGEEWVVGQCSLHIRTNQAFVDLLMHWVTCYWLLNVIALGLAGSDCGTVRSTVNKGWSSLEAECWSAAWQHRKRRGVNFKSLLVRYSQTAQLVWSQNNVKKKKTASCHYLETGRLYVVHWVLTQSSCVQNTTKLYLFLVLQWHKQTKCNFLKYSHTTLLSFSLPSTPLPLLSLYS